MHLTIPRRSLLVSVVVSLALALTVASATAANATTARSNTTYSNGAMVRLQMYFSGSLVTKTVATVYMSKRYAGTCGYAFVNRVNRAPDLWSVKGNGPMNRKCDTDRNGILRWVINGDYRARRGDIFTLWTSDLQTRYERGHTRIGIAR